MDAGPPSRQDVYLIAVHNVVVLQDLADTVRDFDPSATILTATNCAEALARLRSLERLTFAFIEAGSRRIADSRIDAEIRRRDGRIVLLGNEAEDEWDSGHPAARRWPILVRPFSSRTVVSMLMVARG